MTSETGKPKLVEDTYVLMQIRTTPDGSEEHCELGAGGLDFCMVGFDEWKEKQPLNRLYVKRVRQDLVMWNGPHLSRPARTWFHKLWSATVGTTAYDKESWLDVEKQLIRAEVFNRVSSEWNDPSILSTADTARLHDDLGALRERADHLAMEIKLFEEFLQSRLPRNSFK